MFDVPDEKNEAIESSWVNDSDGLALEKLTELPELEPDGDGGFSGGFNFGGGGGFRGRGGGGGFRGGNFRGRGGGGFHGRGGFGGGGFRGGNGGGGFRGGGLKRSFNSMPNLQRASKVQKFE